METAQQPTMSLPWWRTDTYDVEAPMPDVFTQLAGPVGPALVRAWPDGRTDKDWGRETFVNAYHGSLFNARRVLYGYERGRWSFAFIMRSVRLIAVDIDGKNGGLEHAKRLGALPPTLAETSKSGNGFHLFYKVDESWDVSYGYDAFSDHIGIEQGVDIRSTGCVYHHPQQRWNHRDVADLPDYLHELMLARRQRHTHTAERVAKILETGDDMEILMLQDELLSDLKKPMPQGKRNTTLFAIGQKMKQASIPNWEEHVSDRAIEVGLDASEVVQLVRNITNYN